MKQPMTHDRAGPVWPDRWNPYRRREYIGHEMHDAHFGMLLACDAHGHGLHSVDCEGHGCLDAPDEIPGGSTLCVRTIGGWDREEYHRLWRECDDYQAVLCAEAETAQMIKSILQEVT